VRGDRTAMFWGVIRAKVFEKLIFLIKKLAKKMR